ncbi:class I SAM-dependent methyltransferase [Candidatus Gottesmanbacteria bacterium]|nr:class I SAM-dependent methyltransferase [Candidatus Gottesmanbacteria bacterium]
MFKKCHFCKKGKILALFSSNRKTREEQAGAFACTNCGFGKHGPIIKCADCGIIYVDENVSQEKISAYYEMADDPLYFAEQDAREKTFKRYLANLKKICSRKDKLLDVGTFTGLFVKVAGDAGWEAQGLEPNKWGTEYSRKHYNLDITNKPFSIKIFPSESFDVVTMWDVIEHFTDPVAEMKKIFWYLKTGGVFAFSTVDPESFLARIMGTKWSWYMEMHRVFLTRQTAKYYLEKTGFKKIVFRSHWRYLSLGYLSSRLLAINPLLSAVVEKLVNSLGLAKMIVPYYANDLYDCYAFR